VKYGTGIRIYKFALTALSWGSRLEEGLANRYKRRHSRQSDLEQPLASAGHGKRRRKSGVDKSVHQHFEGSFSAALRRQRLFGLL
jgi:hypothetical protein